MTTPEAPDYIIRPGVSTVHRNQNLPKSNQMAMLSQEKQDQFNEWNANIANRDALAAGQVPVSGAGLTGPVKANVVGIAPATSVAVDITNMLVSQNFHSSDTVVVNPDDRWSWDGTDGNLTLGCARVDCNGTQDDLVSNEVPVIEGETVLISCQVKWEGISYTGTDPIVLGVERYRKGVNPETGAVTYLDIGGGDVDALESPSMDGGWGDDGDLAGTYVVEPGVDQIRFRFRAATTITAGVVKWDEAVFLKLDLIDDAAVPGVGLTIDDIVRQLFGTEGDSFTHNDAAVALGNASESLLSLNSRVSALEAGNATGAVAGDDFLWSGEITANANWGGSYTLPTIYGKYSANGADAVWTKTISTTINTTQTYMFDWVGTDEVSDTDYQLVQLLLSSAPGSFGTFKSYVHLLGRVSVGFGSYVLASFGSDGTWFVDYYNGISFVTMRSGTRAVPGKGALLSLYLGNKTTSSPRNFKLMVNSDIVDQFNEVGTGSPLGASNRKWGWGGKAVGGNYVELFIFPASNQARPPKINQWLGYDQ